MKNTVEKSLLSAFFVLITVIDKIYNNIFLQAKKYMLFIIILKNKLLITIIGDIVRFLFYIIYVNYWFGDTIEILEEIMSKLYLFKMMLMRWLSDFS